MAAILLALVPAWALVEMIYRYPETKKGRRAERKRLRKQRLAEDARLNMGRSRAYCASGRLDTNVLSLLTSLSLHSPFLIAMLFKQRLIEIGHRRR
jgi:hypothetical protein